MIHCEPALPPDSEVAVVGVNDGTPFTALPCMDQELSWSPNGIHAQYMILDSPIGSSSDTVLQHAYHGPAGDRTPTTTAARRSTGAGTPRTIRSR
jgi:hypothetical protein